MNRNIKVLNKFLWAVNFNFVLNGYIKEIVLYDTKPNDVVSLANNGVIIINTECSYFEIKKEMLEYVMTLSDDDIGTQQGFCEYIRIFVPAWSMFDDIKVSSLLDEYEYEFQNVKKDYNFFSELEKVRRKKYIEYSASKHNGVIKKIRKGGVNNVRY